MSARLLDRPALARPLPQRMRLALAAESAITYAQVRWLLRRHGLAKTLERLRRPLHGRGHDDPQITALNGARLGWAVTRTLAAIPADSRCLMCSLVLTRLAARRDITTVLVIGVRPGSEFGAHAWLEHAGLPLLPTTDAELAGRLVTL